MNKTEIMKLQNPLKRASIDTEHRRIIESVAGSLRPDVTAPPPQELSDFMFHTENVPADVADMSEKLLKAIMQDHRTLAWTQVDYSAVHKIGCGHRTT